jgi:hypothetical protein
MVVPIEQGSFSTALNASPAPRQQPPSCPLTSDTDLKALEKSQSFLQRVPLSAVYDADPSSLLGWLFSWLLCVCHNTVTLISMAASSTQIELFQGKDSCGRAASLSLWAPNSSGRWPPQEDPQHLNEWVTVSPHKCISWNMNSCFKNHSHGKKIKNYFSEPRLLQDVSTLTVTRAHVFKGEFCLPRWFEHPLCVEVFPQEWSPLWSRHVSVFRADWLPNLRTRREAWEGVHMWRAACDKWRGVLMSPLTCKFVFPQVMCHQSVCPPSVSLSLFHSGKSFAWPSLQWTLRESLSPRRRWWNTWPHVSQVMKTNGALSKGLWVWAVGCRLWVWAVGCWLWM